MTQITRLKKSSKGVIYEESLHRRSALTCQQSQSHRARTVESSRISDTLVSSRMVSPVKWKFRKEPYQLNFKQNWNNINVIYTIINTKIVSSSSSHSKEDMWEKIQIAMILRKIFIVKCFLQYFQCLLDMPFFDSIYIPILKNRHRIYIAYCTNMYQVPLCCPRCSCILIYIFFFKILLIIKPISIPRHKIFTFNLK